MRTSGLIFALEGLTDVVIDCHVGCERRIKGWLTLLCLQREAQKASLKFGKVQHPHIRKDEFLLCRSSGEEDESEARWGGRQGVSLAIIL